MKYLFSKEGRAALDRLPVGALLAFDFDGTIAPEVDEPDEARTPRAYIPMLKKLVRVAPVSVISGRRVQDLSPKLGFKPSWVLGNHGLQSPWSRGLEARAEAAVRDWLKALRGDWAFDPGIWVENKRSSITLHYRMAKNPSRARARLLKLIEERGLKTRLVAGKFVINLTLPKAPHKGTALLQIMKRARSKAALFAGDDVTDEDVFALKKKGLLTVRVGRTKKSAAQFYLRDQEEFARLLEYLAKRFTA